MPDKNPISVLLIGIIISVIAFSAAFLKIHYWHYLAVIGVWFMFDYLSSLKNGNTTLQVFRKKKSDFFRLYTILFFMGCSIELVGRFILHWWTYPPLKSTALELTLVIFYPFILMSFREMYSSIRIIIRNDALTFALSMLAGIIIWEIPNMYSLDWVYTVPYSQAEIFNLPLIVVFGWAILIGFPLFAYSMVLKKS
jgi:hypothetical protein